MTNRTSKRHASIWSGMLFILMLSFLMFQTTVFASNSITLVTSDTNEAFEDITLTEGSTTSFKVLGLEKGQNYTVEVEESSKVNLSVSSAPTEEGLMVNVEALISSIRPHTLKVVNQTTGKTEKEIPVVIIESNSNQLEKSSVEENKTLTVQNKAAQPLIAQHIANYPNIYIGTAPSNSNVYDINVNIGMKVSDLPEGWEGIKDSSPDSDKYTITTDGSPGGSNISLTSSFGQSYTIYKGFQSYDIVDFSFRIKSTVPKGNFSFTADGVINGVFQSFTLDYIVVEAPEITYSTTLGETKSVTLPEDAYIPEENRVRAISNIEDAYGYRDGLDIFTWDTSNEGKQQKIDFTLAGNTAETSAFMLSSANSTSLNTENGFFGIVARLKIDPLTNTKIYAGPSMVVGVDKDSVGPDILVDYIVGIPDEWKPTKNYTISASSNSTSTNISGIKLGANFGAFTKEGSLSNTDLLDLKVSVSPKMTPGIYYITATSSGITPTQTITFVVYVNQVPTVSLSKVGQSITVRLPFDASYYWYQNYEVQCYFNQLSGADLKSVSSSSLVGKMINEYERTGYRKVQFTLNKSVNADYVYALLPKDKYLECDKGLKDYRGYLIEGYMAKINLSSSSSKPTPDPTPNPGTGSSGGLPPMIPPTTESKVTVSITASPTEGGTITGSGSYITGESVTLTATPKQGYGFSGWYNGTKLVSKQNPYTFTVKANMNLTAKFTKTGTTQKPGSGSNSNGSRIPVYRMYNEATYEHLYTPAAEEVKNLEANGWKNEGIGWYSNPAGSGTPVYRLYSPVTRMHLYTTDASEVKYLESTGNWTVDFNGDAIFGATTSGTPIYRLYNEALRAHLLTTNTNEYNVLPQQGWKQEGVAFSSY